MALRNYLSIIEENSRYRSELDKFLKTHEERRDKYLDEFIQAEANYSREIDIHKSQIPQTKREELERRHDITFNRLVNYQFTEILSTLNGGKQQWNQ